MCSLSAKMGKLSRALNSVRDEASYAQPLYIHMVSFQYSKEQALSLTTKLNRTDSGTGDVVSQPQCMNMGELSPLPLCPGVAQSGEQALHVA